MFTTINKENQKIYKRKYQLLSYYNAKQNKTNADLCKIEELKKEIKKIKEENSFESKKNYLQIQLDRLKCKLENKTITKFDIEDILSVMEIQRKTENTKQCINIFLVKLCKFVI